MQGSLIFVVIVAVWAAYLVQHWVRRREDAAATRSVDGFSEAMRVLQKRPRLRGPALAEPRPDSYAVTPARGSRATVEVKRAHPVGSARTGSPLTARSSRGASTTSTTSTASSSVARTVARTAPNQPDLVKVEPMPENRRPNRAPDDARRPAGPSMGQRRVRAALLLVALLWVPTSIAMAATNVLTWLSVPFAVLTVAAVIVWLRTEAAADRARSATREADGAAEPAALELTADDTQAVHTHAYAAGTGSSAAGRTSARGATAEAPAAAVSAETGSEQLPSTRRQVASFFDGEAATAAANGSGGTSTAAGAPAAQAEPLAAGTWSPVPVPRPTYAMKAKAEPRLTESGIPADVFATPEFADEADELDERALFARRAVSG